MENRKDIGKAFREKLEGLEKSPKAGVWNSVNAELVKQRKQAFITKWLRGSAIAGVAALVITLFTYPLWKEHVPHIYLVMPNEKNESNSPENNKASGQDAVAYDETGKPVTNGPLPGGINNPADTGADGAPSGSGNLPYGNNNNEKRTGGVVNNSNTPNTGTAGTKTSSARAGTGFGIPVEGAASKNKDKSSNALTTGSNANNTGGKGAVTTTTKAVSANDTEVTYNSGSPSREEQRSNTATTNTNRIANISKKTTVTESRNTKDNDQPGNIAAKTNNGGDLSSNGIANNDNLKSGNSSTLNGREGNLNNHPVPAGSNNDTSIESVQGTGDTPVDVTTKTTDSLADTKIKPERPDTAKIADSLNKLYNREEKISDKKTRDTVPFKKLYIYAFAAPMQFALPKSGNYLDNSLNSNSASSKTSFAYGGYLGYNITRRLSVRVGAIKTKGELVTNNVLLQNTTVYHEPSPDFPDGWTEFIPPANFRGIQYNEGTTNAVIIEQLTNGMNQELPTATVNVRNNFEFLEIPVELTYRLYERKFGIGLLGGYVIRYSKENTVFAENETGSLEIGKMKKLEDVNTGISFGGSFHYKIMPNLQLNIEPVYKYFFNKEQFIRQHTYSIQAGLRYDFGFTSKKK